MRVNRTDLNENRSNIGELGSQDEDIGHLLLNDGWNRIKFQQSWTCRSALTEKGIISVHDWFKRVRETQRCHGQPVFWTGVRENFCRKWPLRHFTVCALQSKYWGSSLVRGQEKFSRPGAKIATLLLVERKESSQHRVRKSGENLVPIERYTLSIFGTLFWVQEKVRSSRYFSKWSSIQRFLILAADQLLLNV